MGIFSASELAAIRGDLDSLLPGTCNILSLSRTKTSTGGGTVTWGTATAGVACDVWRAGSGREASIGGALVAEAEFTFALPHDTSIDPANRLEHNGNVFQVIGVDNVLPDQLQVRVYTKRSEDTA